MGDGSPEVTGNAGVLVIKLIGIVAEITAACMAIEWVRQKAFSVISGIMRKEK